MGNRARIRVAKTTDLVAKTRRHFLLNPGSRRRTFPSAATGKPDAARKGGDFGNETPHLRNRDGASASNRGPKSLGTEDRARPLRGGRELPHRFGGTGGRSVLRPETAGGTPRGLGTEASAEGPGCRSSSGDRRRPGTAARPAREPRALRRAWRPEDREVGWQPDGRKAGRRPEGRKTGRRPTMGRPGVGAGRQQLRLRSERRRNPERAKVSAGASSGFSASRVLSTR